MSKLTLATEWLAICGGCEIGILDLDENLLSLLEQVEVVYSPVLMDIKEPPKCDVAIVSGCIRNSENEEKAKIMREKADTLIAFGTCACHGGLFSLGGLYPPDELKKKVYRDVVTAEYTGVCPSEEEGLPELTRSVKTLDEVVDVDFYIVGCPPTPENIVTAISNVIENKKGEKRKTVCSECNRIMERVELDRLRRSYEGKITDEKCLISHGLICMGSVTMGGCNAKCPSNGIPCNGCNGPSEKILKNPFKDVGYSLAELVSAITNIELEEVINHMKEASKMPYTFTAASKIMLAKPRIMMVKEL